MLKDKTWLQSNALAYSLKWWHITRWCVWLTNILQGSVLPCPSALKRLAQKFNLFLENNSLFCKSKITLNNFPAVCGSGKIFLTNGKESTVNRALGDSTYLGWQLVPGTNIPAYWVDPYIMDANSYITLVQRQGGGEKKFYEMKTILVMTSFSAELVATATLPPRVNVLNCNRTAREH